jgi:hypothetical protein
MFSSFLARCLPLNLWIQEIELNHLSLKILTNLRWHIDSLLSFIYFLMTVMLGKLLIFNLCFLKPRHIEQLLTFRNMNFLDLFSYLLLGFNFFIVFHAFSVSNFFYFKSSKVSKFRFLTILLMSFWTYLFLIMEQSKIQFDDQVLQFKAVCFWQPV